MLATIAFLVLLLIPVIMLLIQIFRANFSFHWLVAISGAFIAWILVIVSRLQMPSFIELANWSTVFPLLGNPALLVDGFSWHFTTALVTITLAGLLTAVVRQTDIENWKTWGGTLAVTAFSMLAILAANPLTLALGWCALDLMELFIYVTQINENEIRDRFILIISGRLMGLALLIWAMTVSRAAQIPIDFLNIHPEISPFLILACGVRLSVLFLQISYPHHLNIKPLSGIPLEIFSVAASLILLSRTMDSGVIIHLLPVLVILLGLIAFIGSIFWMIAENAIQGQIFWIISIVSFAMVAALRGQISAYLAWGTTGIISGCLLYLYLIHHRRLFPIIVLGLVGISGLPFTPAWYGLQIFLPMRILKPDIIEVVLTITLFLTFIFLLIGYLHHALQAYQPIAISERWFWLVYTLGLLLLTSVNLILGRLNLPHLEEVTITGWTLGIAATGLALGLYFLKNIKQVGFIQNKLSKIRLHWVGSTIKQILSLSWFIRIVYYLYRLFSRVLSVINRMLEGEAGLLWAILMVIFLLTLALPVKNTR